MSDDAAPESRLGTFLAGVRILDLSHYLPGPMATLFLADMGAEVLKVEPPRGDDMRTLGPRDVDGGGLYYRALNAGKRVRTMDLKVPGERGAFLDLVKGADVVVEGFRPGVMQRLGIDYPVLSGANPRIILCSISGYGAGSPKAAQAGHDANYLAQCGILARNGTEAPVYFDPPVSDVAGSLFAAMTILGALQGRNSSGRGCAIDLGLADIAMALQLNHVSAYGATGIFGRRRQTYLNGGAAYYQIYATADGRHLVLGAVEPKFWATFCRAAGRPDWVARHAEPLPQEALRAEVAAYLSTLSTDEAMTRFADPDSCISMIQDLGEALADPDVLARQLVRRGPAGDLQALYPAWIDGIPPATRGPLAAHAAPDAAAPATATEEDAR